MLGACGFGVTLNASSVTGTQAQVSGLVSSDKQETVDYWFEYGPTTDYGQSTSPGVRLVEQPGRGLAVSATLTDLAEGAVTHYRVCTEGADGNGLCGNDMTLTTDPTGRDSVTGSGRVFAILELGFVIAASQMLRAQRTGRAGAGLGGIVARRPLLPHNRLRNRELPAGGGQPRGSRVRALPGSRPDPRRGPTHDLHRGQRAHGRSHPVRWSRLALHDLPRPVFGDLPGRSSSATSRSPRCSSRATSPSTTNPAAEREASEARRPGAP